MHGNKQIKRLLDWLYKNSKYCLNIKRDKKLEFENLLKKIRPIRIRKQETIPEQKMIKDYISGEKICNIDKKYDITNRTMYKILKKNNVSLIQKYDITNRTMNKTTSL